MIGTVCLVREVHITEPLQFVAKIFQRSFAYLASIFSFNFYAYHIQHKIEYNHGPRSWIPQFEIVFLTNTSPTIFISITKKTNQKQNIAKQKTFFVNSFGLRLTVCECFANYFLNFEYFFDLYEDPRVWKKSPVAPSVCIIWFRICRAINFHCKNSARNILTTLSVDVMEKMWLAKPNFQLLRILSFLWGDEDFFFLQLQISMSKLKKLTQNDSATLMILTYSGDQQIIRYVLWNIFILTCPYPRPKTIYEAAIKIKLIETKLDNGSSFFFFFGLFV